MLPKFALHTCFNSYCVLYQTSVFNWNWFLDYEVLRYLMFATDGYRWMITPAMLQQSPGTYYVDIRPKYQSDVNSTDEGVTLRITSFMSKCLYWNITKEKWNDDGCQVSFHLDKVCIALDLHSQITFNVLPAPAVVQMAMCCFRLRWGPEALQSEHNVCVTTSLSLGAPSS